MTTEHDDTTDRPSRYEVVARVRNEIAGIKEEPATITYAEHAARLAGEVLLPDTGRATNHYENQEQRRQLMERAERQIVAERAAQKARGQRGDAQHRRAGARDTRAQRDRDGAQQR